MSKRLPFCAALALALSAAAAGCGNHGEGAPAAPSGAQSGAASAAPPSTLPAAPASSAPSAQPSAPAVSMGPVAADGTFSCGPLKCRKFNSGGEAFRAVLERDKPLILAVGETHAQKGTEDVTSVTARFTDDLLPALEGKASSLVLELWVRDGSCGQKEQKVEVRQKEVTKSQAESNPNEFQKLGDKTKALGIIPFILRPTCEEYDKILKAGDDAVLEMLNMITTNMRTKADKLFDETAKKAPGKMVVLYGGAMHNDMAPQAGREQWSFAKDLDKTAGGKYVELDLIVPEFIKDVDAWKSLRWYPAYDREKMGSMTVLIEMGPRSYALVFPAGK